MQNKNTGIPKYIQKILTKIGYHLPPQFNAPTKDVIVWHYALILSFVLYAAFTIMDIWSISIMSWRAYVLLGLSTFTIMMTQIYKIASGNYRIKSENNKKKQAHKKNRRHIHKVSTNIYYLPFKYESILLAITFFVYLLVLERQRIGMNGADLFTYALQGLMSIIALVNCGMLCVENFAEFYQAKDFC